MTMKITPRSIIIALITAIVLAACIYAASAQEAPRLFLPGYEEPSFHWKPALWMGGIGFAAGASDGLNQMFLFHTQDADNIFGPGTNPDDTWRRKWKGGEKSNGEAFPLSSTLLVFVTDPYHGTRTFTRWTALPQYTIHGYITFQEFYGWKHRTKREKRNIICFNLARILFSEACRNIGFHSTYTVLPTIFND